MTPMSEFVTKNKITLQHIKVSSSPNFSDWKEADHWLVELTFSNKTFVTYYSMGYGHKGKPPTTGEVMVSLLSDVRCADDKFEGFCSDYGYDVDSIKAKAIYDRILDIDREMEEWLGSDLYSEFKEVEE